MKIHLLILLLLIPSIINAQNPQKILLTGIIENEDVHEISIMHIDNPFEESEFNFFTLKDIVPQYGRYIEELESDRPREGLIFTLNNYAKPVFMTPGDSVSFKVKKNEKDLVTFEFTGKNAAHYNYSFVKSRSIQPKQIMYKKGEDIFLYKKAIILKRDKQLKFLEDYKEQYPVSDEFYDYARAKINNEYIYDLYFPLENLQISKKNIPKGYFDEGLAASNPLADLYIVALWDHGMYNFAGDIYKDFGKAYDYVLNGFEGEERAYLMSALLGKLAFRGDLSYKDELLEAIDKMPSFTSDVVCLSYIEKAKDYYTLMERPIPEEVLLKTILTEYGSNAQLSLKEVLQKYEGTAVYIDFWASWCAPCIKDIRESRKAKLYLKGSDVVYLYIGHKDEPEKWREASEKYGITENQYLELNSKESPLTEYLNIFSIPRYVLLDKEHKVANAKAPRPTPEKFDDFKIVVRRLTSSRFYGNK